MKRLAIIGAGGHGKVIADIAVRNGYEDIVFLDDDDSIRECNGYPVIGRCADAGKLDADFIVGIGNADVRRRIQESIEHTRIAALIHPDAVIAGGVKVGRGTVIMAGVVVNPGAVIGRGCIINTCSSIDHDCRIGDFVHVSVGSHLCGTVSVGSGTLIGAGATVVNNVDICRDVVIGAGAVVIASIDKRGTYVGVPAKRARE